MRADARANRTAILEAARGLYAERGLKVPVAAVAERAGVGIGTLYRHFRSSDELIAGAIELVAGRLEEIGARWAPRMAADPETAWPGYVGELVDLRLGSVMQHVTDLPDLERPRRALEAARARILASVDPLLDLAKAAGMVEASVTAAHFYIGLGVITRPIPAELLEHVPGLDDWLEAVYIAGLRAPEPRPSV